MEIVSIIYKACIFIPVYAANVLKVRFLWCLIERNRIWLATYFFFDTIRASYFRARANSGETWEDIWIEVASEAVGSSMNTSIVQTERTCDLKAFRVLGDTNWEQVWQLEIEIYVVKIVESCLFDKSAWEPLIIFADCGSPPDSIWINLTGRKPDVNVSSIVIDNRVRIWCSVTTWHIKHSPIIPRGAIILKTYIRIICFIWSSIHFSRVRRLTDWRLFDGPL